MDQKQWEASQNWAAIGPRLVAALKDILILLREENTVDARNRVNRAFHDILRIQADQQHMHVSLSYDTEQLLRDYTRRADAALQAADPGAPPDFDAESWADLLIYQALRGEEHLVFPDLPQDHQAKASPAEA